MTKKKIIALGTTAVSLLLIAGIGVAAWTITSGGKAESPDTTFPGQVVIPEEKEAEWGTLAVNNAANIAVAYDQNQILFTSGLTESTDWEGFYELPETPGHLSVTWTLKNASDTPPALLGENAEVDFYAYIYINDSTTVGGEKLSDYITFVTSQSDSWSSVQGQQVSAATNLAGTADAVTGYLGYKYKLAIGTSNAMGVYVPTAGTGAADWSSGSITLSINLDNLLVYKDNNKLPLTGNEENAADMLATFQTVVDGVSNGVKVVLKAESKAA